MFGLMFGLSKLERKEVLSKEIQSAVNIAVEIAMRRYEWNFSREAQEALQDTTLDGILERKVIIAFETHGKKFFGDLPRDVLQKIVKQINMQQLKK